MTATTPPTDSSPQPDGQVVVLRGTRIRMSKDFPAPPDGEVLYAKKRPEVRAMSEGEQLLSVRDTRAWQEIMVPACQELDRTRANHGPDALYPSEELELLRVYGMMQGCRSVKEMRIRLTSDKGRTVRDALGLNAPRALPGKSTAALHSGVASEATFSRHNKHFYPAIRLATYDILFKRLRDDHFIEFPELQEECLVLYIDGTHILTHYRPHYLRPLTKAERAQAETEAEDDHQDKTLEELCRIDASRIEATRGGKVTCPDGGFLPDNKETKKEGGPGWNLVTLVTGNALPMSFALVPINAPERATARALLRERFIPEVAPRLDHTKLHVLTADGGFTNQTFRAMLRPHGILDNIHMVSHAKTEKSEGNAEKKRKQVIRIEGFPNWHANGLRDVHCACGNRAWASVGVSERTGRAFARLEGHCPKCGPISITSGGWVRAARGFRRATPDDPPWKRDWTFGNPLTFDDPLAADYGRGRFGHNEGFHGALSTRFHLIEERRWYRTRIEAEIDTLITFCCMHALAMEQRRRGSRDTALEETLAA